MSKSVKTLIAAVALIAAIASSAVIFAHGDVDRPLFVASHGVDRGDCQDSGDPCRTIGYALDRVGKGGQIRVAAGEFEIADVKDVFHVVSGIIDVRGGFDAADSFRQPSGRGTTLVGVPHEYRALLSSRGFHIIADRKSIDNDIVLAGTQDMLQTWDTLQSGLSAAPCVGGQVQGLACENTDLLGHVALNEVSTSPGRAMDIWGFVDLNTNREYVIVGFSTGTGIFDVTDPENPLEVGFVDGRLAGWRDIKVYQHFNSAEGRWNAYAYVTTDGSTDGLFVINLSDLPHSVSRQSYASDFSEAHNIYAANTDYATGLSLSGSAPTLVVAGSNNGFGRFRLYDLSTPMSPAFTTIAGGPSADYMHDAASMIITDARKDTQCVSAVAYCEVLFDFNENSIVIWDITDRQNPVALGSRAYTNLGYTHSGWVSEDGQYLFVHDEADEQAFGLATTVRVFSLANVASPFPAGQWLGATNAIDHNGFVRGNRYYISNYSRGLTILDISNPTTPTRVGRLDTYPFSDAADFLGAWGTYPFLHSGNIAVSDTASGLYIAGDNTLDTPQGSISFAQGAFGAAEGNFVQITLQRTGGTTGAVSVSLAAVPGSAGIADFDTAMTAVNWADGDGTDKTVNVSTVVDATAEGLERAIVNLVAPTGGATIAGIRSASVYVGDAGDLSVVEFADASIDVPERGFNLAVVTVQRSGSAIGAVSVDFSAGAGDAIAGTDYQGTTTGTINWADGDADPKVIEFSIIDDGTGEGNEFFELTLSAANGANIGNVDTLQVNILDGTGSNSSPNANSGASQTVVSGALVTLNGGASNDPDGDNLNYAWSQTMGPAVTLNNANTVNATFTAPNVSSDTLLRFQLQVSDPGGLSDTSTTSITVRAAGGGGNGFGSGGGGAMLWLTLLLFVVARMRRRIIRTDAV